MGTQLPLELQTLHVPHGSPAWAAWQAPIPLQVPPQVPAPPHSMSGSVPVGTGAQVPMLPEMAQDWQTPAQVVLQHTLSTQLPRTHSPPRPHGRPVAFFG